MEVDRVFHDMESPVISYTTCCGGWKNISFPLIIISDTYEGDGDGNPNVHVIRNVAGEESYPWIANCTAMVIPIDDGIVCSGDTVLLTALAMKKKVVVTSPSALAEMYIVHGENGLLCEKEVSAFDSLMNKVLFTEEYDRLQDDARACYLNNYSRESMGKRLGAFLVNNFGAEENPQCRNSKRRWIHSTTRFQR